MAYGITDEGFSLKRMSVIISDINAALAQITDPQTGEVLNLTDENDPLVNIRDALADALAVAWEQLQLAYNQFDPLKATGAGLSGLVQLNALTRHPGIYSTVTLTMAGTPNLYVSSGKQVATYDGLVKFTLPSWTFDGTGASTVVGTCTEEGPLEAGAEDVTKINTPAPGWDSCINSEAATVGSYPETDQELRTRQQQSTETTGRSTIEDIYGNLANLDGVTWARVYQNNTLTTDGRGIPGKSIAPVVLGGSSQDIADILHEQAPALCGFYGTTTVNVSDDQGIAYAVKFTRPNQIPVYVAIELTVVNQALWPTDGDDQIRDAILDYAISGAPGLGIDEGYSRYGFAPGQSVYSSELYTPINSIPGAQVTSLLIGEEDPPTLQIIVIDWDEIATFDADNISITVTP
jgi:uncharacterized phage protein gp47/JayE